MVRERDTVFTSNENRLYDTAQWTAYVGDEPVFDYEPELDEYTMDEDTIMGVSAPGVLGNDTDLDGDQLVVVEWFPPVEGQLLQPRSRRFC